jgi:UDP-N-acetylmuramate dehydrogenase
MNILKYEPLCRHTTLRVGGPAQFFAEAKTETDIRDAVAFAKQNNLPIFVLGGGSNLWVSDQGLPGLVLKVGTTGITPAPAEIPSNRKESPSNSRTLAKSLDAITAEFLDKLLDVQPTLVTVESGETWDTFVAWTVEQGLYGLENMSLIPGTVGGAVIGNIGAYGAEVKDTCLSVEALDLRTGTLRRFNRDECQFAYRHTFFKTPEGRNYLVLRATFALNPHGTPNLAYKDLQDYFVKHPAEPSLSHIRAAIIDIRTRKLPDLTQVGTAGSFFKNPIVPKSQYAALAQRYPGLPGHDEGKGQIKLSLGWILDKICGLKGVCQGPVGTHSAQALVLVNHGGNAAEVKSFAESMTRVVEEKTGLVIEWEVERV